MRRWLAVLTLTALLAAACSSDEGGDSSTSEGVTGADFHSLVADPTRPGRIYVGGHTNVSRSDDRGRTWQPVDELADVDAMGWSIDETSIWVSGHPGLNVSVDGGTSFERRNDGLPDTDVHAFGASATQLFAAGPGLGVVGSSDGGLTWRRLTAEAGQAFFGRILVDPDDPSHLIAADARAGVTESRDGGTTWAVLGPAPAAWVSSPDALNTIYASGGPSAPQRSVDGGRRWTPLSVPAGTSLVEAAPDGTLYAGVHDARAVTVWVSADDGATWTRP